MSKLKQIAAIGVAAVLAGYTVPTIAQTVKKPVKTTAPTMSNPANSGLSPISKPDTTPLSTPTNSTLGAPTSETSPSSVTQTPSRTPASSPTTSDPTKPNSSDSTTPGATTPIAPSSTFDSPKPMAPDTVTPNPNPSPAAPLNTTPGTPTAPPDATTPANMTPGTPSPDSTTPSNTTPGTTPTNSTTPAAPTAPTTQPAPTTPAGQSAVPGTSSTAKTMVLEDETITGIKEMNLPSTANAPARFTLPIQVSVVQEAAVTSDTPITDKLSNDLGAWGAAVGACLQDKPAFVRVVEKQKVPFMVNGTEGKIRLNANGKPVCAG